MVAPAPGCAVLRAVPGPGNRRNVLSDFATTRGRASGPRSYPSNSMRSNPANVIALQGADIPRYRCQIPLEPITYLLPPVEENAVAFVSDDRVQVPGWIGRLRNERIRQKKKAPKSERAVLRGPEGPSTRK
jgi:hypothetical protein